MLLSTERFPLPQDSNNFRLSAKLFVFFSEYIFFSAELTSLVTMVYLQTVGKKKSALRTVWYLNLLSLCSPIFPGEGSFL